MQLNSDWGDLSVGRYAGAGHSSETHGFVSGGQDPTNATNVIDKFTFASDANAADVGNLTVARSKLCSAYF